MYCTHKPIYFWIYASKDMVEDKRPTFFTASLFLSNLGFLSSSRNSRFSPLRTVLSEKYLASVPFFVPPLQHSTRGGINIVKRRWVRHAAFTHQSKHVRWWSCAAHTSCFQMRVQAKRCRCMTRTSRAPDQSLCQVEKGSLVPQDLAHQRLALLLFMKNFVVP